jgi:hypothetical protein
MVHVGTIDRMDVPFVVVMMGLVMIAVASFSHDIVQVYYIVVQW